MIGGADVAGQCPRRRLVDEVQVDITPVLLGCGLRLFDDIGEDPIALERVDVTHPPTATGIRYRIPA